MAEIGIIIPVYNVEKYLNRCVDSVLAQTFGDWKLILVDDGSPDGCSQICDAYAEKDGRIHVIHQKNGGLSAARNAGIDYFMEPSDCSWILFQDSDDWLHPETLQRLYDAVKKYGVKVAVCGFEQTDGRTPAVSQENLTPHCFTAEQFYGAYYINATIACGKLYAKALFTQQRFPVGKLNEDEFLTYRILFAAGRLVWIPAPLYAYYVNNESITHKSWHPQRRDVWEAYEEQLLFFKDWPEIQNQCLRRYVRNVWGQMMQAKNTGNPEYAVYIREMQKKLKKISRLARKSKCLSYDQDFPILIQVSPLRTRAEMYWRAAKIRLKGKSNA